LGKHNSNRFISTIEINENVRGVQKDVTETQTDVKEVLEIQHSQIEKNILQWLTPTEYHSQQHDFSRERQPGTGQWFVNSKEFQSWLQASNHTLFCHGIPGSGKTILTSTVIDNLCRIYSKNNSVGIAYVYCNFRQQGIQKIHDLIATLLRQLAQVHSPLPATVKGLYDQNQERKTQPSLTDLVATLYSVISASSKTFVILDALDELSNDCRRELLSEIFMIRDKTRLNLLLTSRPNQDLERQVKECTSGESIEILARDNDISCYLDGHVSELCVSMSEIPHLWSDIMATISGAVEGM